MKLQFTLDVFWVPCFFQCVYIMRTVSMYRAWYLQSTVILVCLFEANMFIAKKAIKPGDGKSLNHRWCFHENLHLRDLPIVVHLVHSVSIVFPYVFHRFHYFPIFSHRCSICFPCLPMVFPHSPTWIFHGQGADAAALGKLLDGFLSHPKVHRVIIGV